MEGRFGRTGLCMVLLAVWAGIGAFAQAPTAPAGQQPQAAQPPARFAWWRDEHYQKHLALTSDQVSRLESTFQAALPDLRKGRDDLDRQEADLSRLIEMNADESAVIHQVDKVDAVQTFNEPNFSCQLRTAGRLRLDQQ